MKSGDIFGGIASATNTATGIVSGLASNQGTKLPLSAVNKNNSNNKNDKNDKNNQNKNDNTVGKDNVKLAEANNNFYANMGVNLGFNKSSSKTSSHSETAVVTTIQGKDKDSSITYNNVKNIEYVGTQAKDTKFIYNNVDNITKKAVELNNSYSSDSKSSGVSAGVNIGYGRKVLTDNASVSVSSSKSNMNSNGTSYQNGLFVNVDEEHNNTKNMTLSGFNQVGGKVTGNIQNLTIESKQNTSTTTGSTKGGSIGFAPNGMPTSISANYSQTNGERKYVDDPTTFIIGDGSNLKVGKVENTAAAIGTSGNGKLSIDEYVGHNLENNDETKTKGGSVSLSQSSIPISGVGVNYANRDLESVTKNTVVGNVEIGKSSGDEINKDLDTMTEVTKDEDTKTNVFVESQTIRYAVNPDSFKEDIQKAKNEIADIGNVVENTINPKGLDKRNVLENLRAQRGGTTLYNVVGSRAEALDKAFKDGTINKEEYKEAVREVIKGYGKDIGVDFEVVYLDEGTMPKDAVGSTGAAFINKETGKMLIPIDVSKIEDTGSLWGVIAEEISHIQDGLAGRQDKKVANDISNKEKGLESLGRPINDYVKNKLGEDNNSKIKLSTDGIDLTNANVGEKVGDVITPGDREFRTGYQAKYKYIQMDFDRTINGMIGLTGSAFRGGASYGLITTGYSLMLAPEPLGTKVLGGGFILGGLIAGAFTASDAVESGQDVYYGVTNQRNKKSVNFGRELLGEDTYDPLDMLSVAGMPILYDYANYTKVMVEGEAAKRALATNMANQNQISNVTVDTNKSLNIKQQEGQNPQQRQRSQDNIAQNNKNSINKTQAQESQNNPSNQQVSKGATSNNQQGTPVSKTSDVNKLEVSKGSSDTTQKVVSTVSNNNKVGNLIFYAEENGEVKVIDKSNDTGKIAKNTKGMKPIKKEQALEDIFTKEQEILKTSNPNIGVKDINKNGIKIKYDKEKYIKQIEDIKLGDLNGKKTENLVDDILNDFTKKNPDFEIIDAKYGSDNGIDHMLKNKKTGELWILDSKQMSEKSITYEGGAVKLSKDGAGGNIQLSSEWVNSVAGKKTLNETAKKELEKAIKTQNYKTGIVALDKKTGDLIVAPIEITPKKSKK
ncbi:hemagglutinin repeat-containing protein [Fusobacterium polymorphum]|nr:hemagglutinin repeat-containing protein [Fusobacterium polymorphum]